MQIPINDLGNLDTDSKAYKDLPVGDELDYKAMQKAAEVLQGAAKKTGNLYGEYSGNLLGVGMINVTISLCSDGHDYKILISIYEGMEFTGKIMVMER